MITSDYSLTKLFLTKEINISIDSKQSFKIVVKTLKDFFDDHSWNGTYHLWTLSAKEWQRLVSIELESSFDYIQLIVLELGKYKQYAEVARSFKRYLAEIIPDIQFNYVKNQSRIYIGDITITSEIWDYVVYLLKLTCGEKVNQPLIFNSPEEHAFYLKQQEMEEKIRKIKNENSKGDKDGLLKSMLSITYSFPSLTFEYLFNQTMAQIHWLQKMAAGEVSYRVNAQAMAAGNMKKGKKLEFFIK